MWSAYWLRWGGVRSTPLILYWVLISCPICIILHFSKLNFNSIIYQTIQPYCPNLGWNDIFLFCFTEIKKQIKFHNIFGLLSIEKHNICIMKFNVDVTPNKNVCQVTDWRSLIIDGALWNDGRCFQAVCSMPWPNLRTEKSRNQDWQDGRSDILITKTKMFNFTKTRIIWKLKLILNWFWRKGQRGLQR